MTVITGETGAVNLLRLMPRVCVRGRALRPIWSVPERPAPICARFGTERHACGIAGFENQLEEGRECLLRRVISSDGRSRGFITRHRCAPVSIAQPGQLLIQIHGQHAQAPAAYQTRTAKIAADSCQRSRF